jgi:hypothetical protein
MSKTSLDNRKGIATAFEEIENESDRHAAILAVNLLEHSLEEAIKSRFIPISMTLNHKLFRGYGPLATVSGKIDIAYALDLIDLEERTNLHTIRAIRNEFAHCREILDFNIPRIAKMCQKITVNLAWEHTPPTSNRGKYTHSVQYLSVTLIGRRVIARGIAQVTPRIPKVKPWERREVVDQQ